MSAPAGVFPTTVGERSTNKIVGIDTTLVDFRNIGFDPDTESPSNVVFKFELEDNIYEDEPEEYSASEDIPFV